MVWHLLLWKRGPKAPKMAQRAIGTHSALQPSTRARRRAVVHPKLKVSQYFLAPMGVLPKFDLLKKIANVTLSKKYYKNIFFLEIQKHTSFLNSLIFNRKFFYFRKNIFLSTLFGKCYIGYFFNKSNFFESMILNC